MALVAHSFSKNDLLDGNDVRVMVKEFVGFHSDGLHRTALSAQPAADANGFILHHDGAFGGGQLARGEVLQINLAEPGLLRKARFRFLGKLELAQWHKLQAILRTNVHAAAAQNAFGAVLLGAGIFLVHRQIERRIDQIGKL